MSDDLIQWLERQLKPGYKFLPAAVGGFRVTNPEGDFVRNAEGQPVIVYPMNGWHYRKRALSNLQSVGAVPKAKRRRTNTAADHVKSVPVVNRKNPIITADEILRDPKASPRERAMAREYKRVSEENIRVMALVESVRHREKMRLEVILALAKKKMTPTDQQQFIRDIRRIIKD